MDLITRGFCMMVAHDGRDIVRGYWLLLEPPRANGFFVDIGPVRLRPSDAMIFDGEPSKIEKTTGWKVAIPFERTLQDLLEYWRKRVGPGAR
jgi:GDP-D-mannose dehydratase